MRSVFIIDPSHVIRLILMYPASCGRNFDEIIRVIDSLQLTTYQKVTTPGEHLALFHISSLSRGYLQPIGSPATTSSFCRR